MTHLFIDIETVPPPMTETLRDQIRAGVKLGNLKDPAKIEAKLMEAETEGYRRLSLDPLRCDVVTVGIAVDWSDPSAVSLDVALDELANRPGAFLVGHNVEAFDIIVLAMKALRLRHRAAAVLWGHLAAKPWERRIHDTLSATSYRTTFGKREVMNLDTLCELLGLPGPKPGSIDGSQVYDAWKAGDLNAITEHVLDDVYRERGAYLALCDAGVAGWSVPGWARGVR